MQAEIARDAAEACLRPLNKPQRIPAATAGILFCIPSVIDTHTQDRL